MKSIRAFEIAFIIGILGAIITESNLACAAFGLREVDVRFIAATDGGVKDAARE